MPIVSADLTATGTATVSWGEFMGGLLRSASQAVVSWTRNLADSTGVLNATGSGTMSASGSTVSTAIAVGGYTYESVTPTTFSVVSVLRRQPEPKISNTLGASMSNATFRVYGPTAPVGGQDVQLDFSDGYGVLVAGTVQTVSEVLEPFAARTWDITLIQYAWLLASRCPYGCWTGVSATTVVQALIAGFAPGFTSVNVQAALPAVTVTFNGTKTLVDCLNEIAQQVAGLVGACFFYVDVTKDVHFFETDATNLPEQLNNTTNTTLLQDPQPEYEIDDSQIRNRASILGVSTTVMADAPAGASEIEIDNGSYFTSSGMVSTGCQRIATNGSYSVSVSPARPTAPSTTGTNGGSGGGSLTFSASQANDATPPYAQPAGKIHVPVKYAFSVVEASGNESDLSDVASVGGLWTTSVGSIASVTGTTGGNVPQGILLRYKVTAYDSAGGIGILQAPNDTFITITLGGSDNAVAVALNDEWNPMTAGRHIWRQDNNTGLFYFVGSYPGRLAGTFTDTKASADLLQARANDAFGTPYFFDSTGKQVDVAIPSSAAGTSRKLYRSVGDASGQNFGPFRLLATLDAASTPYRDNNETPRPDQVLYNLSLGLSADGISSAPAGTEPPSTTPTITRTFLRVGGLSEAIPKGAKLSLFYQNDNLDSQAYYAARAGGDGIRELPTIVNESLTSYNAMAAVVAAQLSLFSSAIQTLRYSTLDNKSQVGKIIDVNLTSPPVVTTLMIQSVTLDWIRHLPGKPPRYNVVASSVKFTLNDFLRTALLAA